MNWFKWLLRGKGVKPWALLAIVGVILIWNGVAWHYGGGVVTLSIRLNELELANFLYRHTVGGALLMVAAGFLLLLCSFYKILEQAVRSVTHEKLSQLPNKALYTQAMLAGPKIVAIGGGTGLSNFLAAIKDVTANITAIVAVTDDGGSSGRLRRDLGILPPGDVRNCLIALSESQVNMEEVLAYNFPQDSDLAGHNLGNLMMAGLVQSGETDFATAIARLSEVLAIRGRVLPSTVDNVEISGVMSDGTIIKGETDIVKDKRQIERVFLTPEDCAPLPQALQAIREADYIFIGPGSLYTSVITNLLVPQVAAEIKAARGKVFYICNIVTQPGEMEQVKASQYVEAINHHIGRKSFFNIIVNDGEFTNVQKQYLASRNCRGVICDSKRLQAMGLRVLKANLINEDDVFKHDRQKLRDLIMAEIHRDLGL